MKVITIDVERNTAQLNDTLFKGRGRYECAVIGAFLQSRSGWLDSKALRLALSVAGQKRMLDRTGINRLLSQVDELVDRILGPGASRDRLHYAPRHRTVGPWRWIQLANETWKVLGSTDVSTYDRIDQLIQPSSWTRLSPNTDPKDFSHLTVATNAMDMIRALELTLASDALVLEGMLDQAARSLDDALSVQSITDEMRCVLMLRLAKIFKQQGRYGDAREMAGSVAKRASHRAHPDPSHAGLASQLLRRIAYDQNPAMFADHDPGVVDFRAMPGPDPRGMADSENLEALVLRRCGLAHLRNGARDLATRSLRQAWTRCSEAMYWAVSSSDHQNAENIAFNLGLIQASLHDCEKQEDSVLLAFGCYMLGLRLRDDFLIGKDTVWDQIFIGMLWLDHPDLRREFEGMLSFDYSVISSADFYVSTLKEAVRLKEPRQIAFASLNLWRFSDACSPDDIRHRRYRSMARKELLLLKQQSSSLINGMLNDYPVIFNEIFGTSPNCSVNPVISTE